MRSISPGTKGPHRHRVVPAVFAEDGALCCGRFAGLNGVKAGSDVLAQFLLEPLSIGHGFTALMSA